MKGSMQHSGTVHFIGVGPGDPELITLKAKRLIGQANVIVYAGSLVNPALLENARPDVELHNSASMKLDEQVQVMVAAVDGLSPFLAALLVVMPFFLVQLLPSVVYAYYASIGMAMLSLFALGIYLGRISKQNLIISGVKTCIAGVICIALSYLIERLA